MSRLKHLPSWDEFLRRWNNVEYADERIGLLHAGFTLRLTPFDTAYHKRLRFYLETADGHAEERPDRSDAESAVKSKAFQMLAQHEFKRSDCLDVLAANPATRKAIFSFLQLVPIYQPRDGHRVESLANVMRRIGPKHKWQPTQKHLETTQKWVLHWCATAWNASSGPKVSASYFPRSIALPYRPHIVRILFALDKLEWLGTVQFPLDDIGSLMALKRLAVDEGQRYPEEKGDVKLHRSPESLEESIANGSQPARILRATLDAEKWRKQASRNFEPSRYKGLLYPHATNKAPVALD